MVDSTIDGVSLQLTQDELALICEALDSHIYWQLSDEHYRHDGYVRGPGSDDDENAEGIAEAEALLSRLTPLLRDPPNPESS